MGLFSIHTFVLMRIRIFTLRDLWLFLIGVMFVSTTSGAIAAFIMGVSEEEFFIDEVDNILIVTEPGSTTPLTSMVPDYVQTDIQKVRGVIATSAETMCVSIVQNLNDQSIIARGITPDFIKITPTNLIEGTWFDPEFDQFTDIHVSNGAMVGYILAEGLGLECGDKLQLASTVTDVVMEIVITGIIRSNTPTDEELLVSLSVGKILAKKEATFVSFIRVLVNEEILTKEQLANLLNEVFTLDIMLSTQDPDLAAVFMGTPIVAYTPTGAYVETQTIKADNTTQFELKFGSYEFIATPSGHQNSPPLSVFLNQSFTDPFEIRIGASYYDLQFNITYNRVAAENASIIVQNKFFRIENYSSQTDSKGLAQFNHISENFYDVYVNFREIQKNVTIKLSETTLFDIELENSLSLTILNITSGQLVHGGSVRVFNTSYLIQNYQCGEPIFLDYPGEYTFEFQYNETLREFSSLVNGIGNHTIYVGTVPLIIWTRGEDRISLESTNVSITRFNKTIAQAFTDTHGTCEFQLETGLDYNITAIPVMNQSRVQEWEVSLISEETFIIDFLNYYSLDVIVFNGTSLNSSNNELADCDVVILKNATLVASATTNISGMATFQLSEPGVYEIRALKDGFRNTKYLTIRQTNGSFMLSLGNVFISILTQSIGEYPISGTDILLKSGNNGVFSGETNSSGLVELVVPVDNYILEIVKNSFIFQKEILFEESQRISFVQLIELSGDLSITLTNQFSQKITKAKVVLSNEYYGIEFSGFTDDNGEITYYTIPWANYSVNITFANEFFPVILIEFVELEGSFQFKVDTVNPILKIEKIDWDTDSNFSVVLSSEFVSSFLQTTLAIILTTLTSIVIIISVLSLLSITSVISQPIVSNERTLVTFKRLGATKSQVMLGVVFQLSILGLIASILGSLSGMWVMTIFPMLKNVNVGGIIIRPKIDLWLSVLIVLSNLGVIILKASQKVRQLHTLY